MLGAGPIGQCVCLVARERGAEVLVVDLQERRLALSRAMGAETLGVDRAPTRSSPAARRWAGAGGPPVAIDATGAPAAVRAMVDMVASAGRAVQVGMSRDEVTHPDRQPDREGARPARRELLRRRRVRRGGGGGRAQRAVMARLISHEFPLERAPEAIRFAMSNPTEVMKVVIGAA